MMLNQDPPSHARLRRIVAAAFTPRAIRQLEGTIAQRARELVDGVIDRGRADFVELAADLPVWTLARIMGVPDGDRRLLYDWASRVIGYQDAEYAGLSTIRAERLKDLMLGRTSTYGTAAPGSPAPDHRAESPGTADLGRNESGCSSPGGI